MVRRLILDFDTTVYKIALRGQDDLFIADEDFDETITDEEYEEMFEAIEEELNEILFDTDCTQQRIYLTGSNNFRYKFLPSYKWRRDPNSTPKALAKLKNMCLNRLADCYRIDGEEADDSCTRDFSTKEEGIYKVLGHIDKDLNQVAGEHYDYNKGETYFVTEKEASDWLWYQVLAGDSADCYKGCPYVGGEISKNTKKAERMTNKERIYNSKAMRIVQGTLMVKPHVHHFTSGKKKGTYEIKWEEYHDNNATIEQRVLSWYIKGYVKYGGIGHVKGFDTTSGFEDNVKVPYDIHTGLSNKSLEFIKKEIAIQYTIAYMLKSGESIPTKLHKLKI